MIYKKIAFLGLISLITVSHTTYGMNKQESRKETLREWGVFAGGFVIGMVAWDILRGTFFSKKSETKLENKQSVDTPVTGIVKNVIENVCTSVKCKNEREKLKKQVKSHEEDLEVFKDFAPTMFITTDYKNRLNSMMRKPFWKGYQVNNIEFSEVSKLNTQQWLQIQKIKEQK